MESTNGKTAQPCSATLRLLSPRFLVGTWSGATGGNERAYQQPGVRCFAGGPFGVFRGTWDGAGFGWEEVVLRARDFELTC